MTAHVCLISNKGTERETMLRICCLGQQAGAASQVWGSGSLFYARAARRCRTSNLGRMTPPHGNQSACSGCVPGASVRACRGPGLLTHRLDGIGHAHGHAGRQSFAGGSVGASHVDHGGGDGLLDALAGVAGRGHHHVAAEGDGVACTAGARHLRLPHAVPRLPTPSCSPASKGPKQPVWAWRRCRLNCGAINTSCGWNPGASPQCNCCSWQCLLVIVVIRLT